VVTATSLATYYSINLLDQKKMNDKLDSINESPEKSSTPNSTISGFETSKEDNNNAN
jgi:hypothetical protein